MSSRSSRRRWRRALGEVEGLRGARRAWYALTLSVEAPISGTRRCVFIQVVVECESGEGWESRAGGGWQVTQS